MSDKADPVMLHEVDAFFITLHNPSRFTKREPAKPAEIDSELDDENKPNEFQDRLSSSIIYPPILPHHNKADR